MFYYKLKLWEYKQSIGPSTSCNIIKTFDFSTIYTTIPHYKLKDRLRELIQLLHKKEWSTYIYVLERDRS